ncbi:class I SAM-dependent methyltransferase [Actinoplanes sp. CA-015351]|uniref:class I SAM-dependent methyltransferase n=1 Tax=Actinoplanes sp. CA-015351 TaxID=3239897 RepID=UPI003D953010
MTETQLTPFIASRADGFDGLRLVRPSFVPELRLHLADDPIVLRARIEAEFGPGATPFWAIAWIGGQALARYVLDHPEVVAGRRVLDVGSGGGIAAIAAAKAGASTVIANDIDPYALVAATMNAEANAVAVTFDQDELLDGDGGDAEVILIGDAFYASSLAVRMQSFLQRAVARGAHVLVGDPDRGHLPASWLKVLTSYRVSGLGAAEDSEITRVSVLGPANR